MSSHLTHNMYICLLRLSGSIVRNYGQGVGLQRCGFTKIYIYIFHVIEETSSTYLLLQLLTNSKMQLKLQNQCQRVSPCKPPLLSDICRISLTFPTKFKLRHISENPAILIGLSTCWLFITSLYG